MAKIYTCIKTEKVPEGTFLRGELYNDFPEGIKDSFQDGDKRSSLINPKKNGSGNTNSNK